jgi:hypothetical protein
MMNFLLQSFFITSFFIVAHFSFASSPKAGFSMPDNVPEVTMKFHRKMNLIVLPVTINDSITVNLILDTGCRNLVLFGKRFQKRFNLEPDRKISFSGLGDGDPVDGKLAINNKVSIHTLIGESIPVIIIPNQNLFPAHSNIHGIIGYDVFIKFEIEFSLSKEWITFRPAATAEMSAEYEKIPLRIKDSRPLIQSKVFFSSNEGQDCDLMLDTGSTLGLIFKTSDLKFFSKGNSKKVIGRGLNGDLTGFNIDVIKLVLNTFEIKTTSVGVIYSAEHNYASAGMNIMKNYTVVLNYCKAYAGFKKP